MRTIRIIMLLLCSLVWMVGCSSDDDNELNTSRQTDEQIKFEISLAGESNNRLKMGTASDFTSTWETGDEIGVFAIRHGQSLAASGNYIHNVKLTLQSDGTWKTDVGSEIFYPNNGDALDFYAYYPYDDSMSDPTTYTFSVQTNQSTVASYSKNDLLLAQNNNGGSGFVKGATNVSLQFTHALSLVQVELVSGNAMGANLNGMEKVYLRAIGTTSSFNLSIGTVIADASETVLYIQMIKIEELTNTYRALIPAQSISSGTALFVISRGGSLKYTTNANVILTKANATKYTITLQAPTLDPTHAYNVGDPYPYVGLAEGIVWEVSNDGLNGKIMSLDENSMAHWDDSFFDTNARDNYNGRINMGAISSFISNSGKSWTNFPHFKWIHDKNGGGTTNYYIDPNVKNIWYLPSIDELQSLYCVFNNKAAETWYWQGSANPNEKYPTFKNEDTTSARNEFNQKLASYGGTALSLNWHWSSTEVYGTFGASYANDMNFSDGESYASSKHQTNNARAMMAF